MFQRFITKKLRTQLAALALSGAAFVPQLQAQKLLIVNGGLFGGSDYTNLGLYDPFTDAYTPIDTIRVNSAQDVYIESNRYAYVAAQDSIVKYDLQTRTRLAATAFNAPSTVRLRVYQNDLIVGNWYAPFGHTGAYTNNLRIFDKNTLAYLDSIPEVTKGATDFLILGDTAYIAQNNNDASTNFQDSLGYLAVVNLATRQFVRYDTLSTSGHDLGRLVHIGGSQIYSFNSVSNTVSALNLNNGQRATGAAGVDLQLPTTGAPIWENEQGSFYALFNGTIGRFDLSVPTNTADSIVLHGQAMSFTESFAFAYDSTRQHFYGAKIFYSNQAANVGIVYNLQGDSIGNFPVGFSPEVLAIYDDRIVGAVEPQMPVSIDFSLYPNPSTSGSFHLELAQLEAETSLEIYAANGQLLVQKNLNSLHTDLALEQLPAGMYWCAVRVQGRAPVFKRWVRM